MGQSIGFRFPKDPYECDRAEISQLIAGFGGSIFQGGGSPGAESFATFEGVKDKETADAKIKAILPELTLLMQSLKDDKATKAILARHPIPERKCREGEPGGITWPGGTYKGKDYSQFCWICRNGKMVVDEEASRRATEVTASHEKARTDLLWAARTRILSEEEMTILRELGSNVFVSPGVPFHQEGVDRQFNDLLLQQFRMREIKQGVAARDDK
jgi:hypothetical protein